MPFLIRLIIPRTPPEPKMNGNLAKDADSNQTVDEKALELNEISMEDAIHQILKDEKITSDVWNSTKNDENWVVEFQILDAETSERVLDKLAFYNIGKTSDSSIMVIEPTAVISRKKGETEKKNDVSQYAFKKFVQSLKSRLTVAQVYHTMSQRGNFDVNYLAFLLCAAIVACIALVTNSAAVVFASMLLSPLMDPIMCTLFGLSLQDPKMIKQGFRNGGVSLLICLFVGFFFGIVAHYVSAFEGTTPYPTSEMVNRGRAKGLISSAIVAFFSGVSVAFATLHNSLAALIGNAISLSLLPPAVNAGQFLFLSMLARLDQQVNSSSLECSYSFIREHRMVYFDTNDYCNMPMEFVYLSLFSFILTCLNIILVVITGYGVNRLKDLAPRSFTNNVTRTFYQNDVKEFHKNYDCLHKLNAPELAKMAFLEYTRLQNNGEDKPLTLEETDRLTKEFDSVIEGVNTDLTLSPLTSNIGNEGRNFLENFRRWSMVVTTDKQQSQEFVNNMQTVCAGNRDASLAEMVAASERMKNAPNDTHMTVTGGNLFRLQKANSPQNDLRRQSSFDMATSRGGKNIDDSFTRVLNRNSLVGLGNVDSNELSLGPNAMKQRQMLLQFLASMPTDDGDDVDKRQTTQKRFSLLRKRGRAQSLIIPVSDSDQSRDFNIRDEEKMDDNNLSPRVNNTFSGSRIPTTFLNTVMQRLKPVLEVDDAAEEETGVEPSEGSEPKENRVVFTTEVGDIEDECAKSTSSERSIQGAERMNVVPSQNELRSVTSQPILNNEQSIKNLPISTSGSKFSVTMVDEASKQHPTHRRAHSSSSTDLKRKQSMPDLKSMKANPGVTVGNRFFVSPTELGGLQPDYQRKISCINLTSYSKTQQQQQQQQQQP